MEGQPQITILHLSDLQFGKHHRFAGVDLTGLPNPYDTLLARLWDDLQRLRKDHRLQPDLVIITGDLVEWGMPDEFRVVREFLEKLTDKDHLNLPRQRIAIIPGNHDINRKACHAYFLNCEASGTPVTPPWWPKWQFYASMFAEFYRDAPGVTFVPEQPWTLFEVPELKVVIAGLNSTMVEGHDCQESGKTPDPKFPRHVGICSEPQYRWFAERLAKHREEGWLRLGAVHHNQQRKCKDDEENLEDADTLEQVLGPSLNLLLHGHTHEAKLAWLDQHTPIISTGSAALDAKVRPAEIPNQYQILQVSPCVLRRFGRAFFPASRTFGADARVGKNDGLEEKTVLFVGVSGAFPGGEVDAQAKAANPNSRWRRSEDLDTNRPTDNYRRDDFLARVAEVCKFRRPAAAITPVHCGLAVNSVMDYLKLASSPEPDWQLGAGLDYLRVVERSDTIVRQYPVGVFQHGFTGEDLARFVTFVDAPYRACDSGLISEIVYSGERPAEEVFREAWRRSIRLQSFAEYQGLIDFTPYVQKQTDKLERDTIYPPSLYVPQRMRYHFGEKEEHTEDAFAQVQEWLIQPHPRFVLILGDFGTGKTFLLHELARRLGRDGTGLTPLFVELRALEKAQSLDALVAQHLAKSGEDRIDLPAFRYMLQQGRIVLFFDGFDELALRVSYDRAAEHFDTLIQAAAGDAKVVVTSRTQHFESDRQVRTVLYDRAQPLPGLRYCKLQPFTEHQIKLFLRNRWQDEREAEHWFGLITHVKDLLGLSENPRMLGFITELRKEDIAKAKQREGVISAADLYRLLLEKWLNFEDQRAHPKGAQVVLPAEARWAAANAIALRLWEKTEKFVTAPEIAEVASASVARLMATPPPADIAGHLIGSGSLLRRDDEGCFFFVHQSVMEWLVAREAAEQVKQSGASPLLGARAVSPLMAEFFCDLAGHLAAEEWASAMLSLVLQETSIAKTNALEVLKRLGTTTPVGMRTRTLNLSGQDLRGKSFVGQSLVGADLSGTNLTEARLVGLDLSGAKLDGACLVRADLSKAILANASLVQADFTSARLMGADLEGANFAGASLRRAGLVAARRFAPLPGDCDLLGAALPADVQPLPFLTGASACHCVAWHPKLELVASGHDDGTIRLWEAASGKELRQFSGHQRAVSSVAFSPDGQRLASASHDQTVRLWEAASGKELRQFSGHQDRVLSVAFSPDGRRLASGGGDQTVRLWEAASGKELRQFAGHTNWVRSVAFSPDGQRLASGSHDQTVRLWEAATGKELRQFQGHQGGVNSVAFSPDGRHLASGNDDKTLRLWEAASGKELRQFQGHQASVWSVAFSPDGRHLTSGSDDNTLRLWEAASGKELRQFQGHQGGVNSVAFSPDGRHLASGSDDKTLRLWEAASGKELRQFQGHQARVWSVAFSPDGRHLASGSADKTLRLWEAASGKELRQFQGHQAYVRSVAFSPDGRQLASGSDDGTVRLWDVRTGACLAVLRSFAEGWVAFTPAGRYKFGGNLAGGFWHAIALCRFEPGELDEFIPGLRMPDEEPLFT